jgi:hypothetical protein
MKIKVLYLKLSEKIAKTILGTTLIVTTVKLGYNKLGYNELGYNELPLITNRFTFCFGIGYCGACF